MEGYSDTAYQPPADFGFTLRKKENVLTTTVAYESTHCSQINGLNTKQQSQ